MLTDGQLDDREVEIEVTPAELPDDGDDAAAPGDGGDRHQLHRDAPGDAAQAEEAPHGARCPRPAASWWTRSCKKLVDMDDVVNEALDRVENHGIIFIDEIDKIAGERGQARRPGRLPRGRAARPAARSSRARPSRPATATCGATTSSSSPPARSTSPSRRTSFPSCRAASRSGSSCSRSPRQDFVRIMTEPENALTKQYRALVAAEGAQLEFTPDGIAEVARVAFMANDRMENIGARRLHTVMSALLEETAVRAARLARASGSCSTRRTCGSGCPRSSRTTICGGTSSRGSYWRWAVPGV